MIILGVFCLLAYAHPLYAALEITEIMYDPQGTDTDREWVEIHNPDAQSVDLSQWSFWQGGTNHKIHTDDGTTAPVIPAASYAIIAHNTASMLAGWPQTTGLIFDASFSLKNTGELIELKNGDNVVDQINFDPTIGAAGDGNSLQKNASGVFVAAPPTPDAPLSVTTSASVPAATSAPASAPTSTPDSSDSVETQAVTDSTLTDETIAAASSDPDQGDLSSFPTSPQITAKINASATWTVGVSGVASAAATGLQGQPLENAQYLWNFGDGTSAQDQKVSHTYKEAGQYIISLSVGSGQYSASDRVVVNVIAPRISLSSTMDKNSVTLENDSASELDLSGFFIISHDQRFIFPQNSFIGNHQTLTLDSDTLGMSVDADTTLSYPNGVVLASDTISDISAPASAPIQKAPPKTTKKVKAPTKVLSAKVSASIDVPDASETDPIILSADLGDDDTDASGSGAETLYILIFSVAAVALLGAFFLIMKKRRQDKA